MGKSNCVAQFIKKITTEVAGEDLNDVCDVSKQDLAALSVAKELGISKIEACDMHDGNKIGWSAIGELVRTKDKIPVNPFPKGVNIMEKISYLRNIFFPNTNS